MIRRIIGGALLALGLIAAVVLVSYGGGVFPHIVGPALAIVIGAVLIVPGRKQA